MSILNVNVGGNTAALAAAIQSAVDRGYTVRNLNVSGISQPLGRITGQADEFTKSLEASNARVIAFGASAGAIFAIRIAFEKLVTSTIEVEKSLTDINSILGLSSSQLNVFSAQLFTVASQTATSFQNAALAATEFSRQGLSAEETILRTKDALILARLSGLGFEESVSSLTAAVNSFGKEALTTSEVVNRLATVDAAFSVSSNDLAQAIKRVGSSAQDANVSLNQTIALVTAAQQTTSRGGAVIGNSFKTIFTRLQRPEVLNQLEAIGVKTRDAAGNTLPLIEVLKGLAFQYDKLSSSQKSHLSELVGGVYQINVLKAVLGDLGGGLSIYEAALRTAERAADAANRRNDELNTTLSAKLVVTLNNVVAAAAKIGDLTISPALKGGTDIANSLLGGISQSLSGDDLGAKIGRGLLSGIGNVLQGPGLQMIVFIGLKLMERLTRFGADAAAQFSGMNSGARQQEAIQLSISNHLARNPALVQQIFNGTMSVAQAQAQIVTSIQQQNALLSYQKQLAASITTGVIAAGVRVVPRTPASGFIPNFNDTEQAIGQMAENVGAKSHGYTAGKAYETTVHDGNGNSFPTFVNSREKVETFTNSAGYKATMVTPPNGFGEGTMRAASGFIPKGLSPGMVKQLNKRTFSQLRKSEIVLSDIFPERGPAAYHRQKAMEEENARRGIPPQRNLWGGKYRLSKPDLGLAGGFVPNSNNASGLITRAVSSFPTLSQESLTQRKMLKADQIDSFNATVGVLRLQKTIKEYRDDSDATAKAIYPSGKKGLDNQKFSDFKTANPDIPPDRFEALRATIATFHAGGRKSKGKGKGSFSNIKSQIQGIMGETDAQIATGLQMSKTNAPFDLSNNTEVKTVGETQRVDILKKGIDQYLKNAKGKGIYNGHADNYGLGLLNLVVPSDTKVNSSGFIPNFTPLHVEVTTKKIADIRELAARVRTKRSQKTRGSPPEAYKKVSDASAAFEVLTVKALRQELLEYPGTKVLSATPTNRLSGGLGYGGGPSFPGYDSVFKLITSNPQLAQKLGIPLDTIARVPVSSKASDSVKLTEIEKQMATGREILKLKSNRPLGEDIIATRKNVVGPKQKKKVTSFGPPIAAAGGFVPNFALSPNAISSLRLLARVKTPEGNAAGDILARLNQVGGKTAIGDLSLPAPFGKDIMGTSLPYSLAERIQSAARQSHGAGAYVSVLPEDVARINSLIKSNPSLADNFGELSKLMGSGIGATRFAHDGFIPNFTKSYKSKSSSTKVKGYSPKKPRKFIGMAEGFVPNFDQAEQDAVSRERAAGIPNGAIRVGTSPELITSQNPDGRGVWNTVQESGLNQGIKFSQQAGIDPRTKGMSGGFIPNFAQGDPSAIDRMQMSMSASFGMLQYLIADRMVRSVTSFAKAAEAASTKLSTRSAQAGTETMTPGKQFGSGLAKKESNELKKDLASEMARLQGVETANLRSEAQARVNANPLAASFTPADRVKAVQAAETKITQERDLVRTARLETQAQARADRRQRPVTLTPGPTGTLKKETDRLRDIEDKRNAAAERRTAQTNVAQGPNGERYQRAAGQAFNNTPEGKLLVAQDVAARTASERQEQKSEAFSKTQGIAMKANVGISLASGAIDSMDDSAEKTGMNTVAKGASMAAGALMAIPGPAGVVVAGAIMLGSAVVGVVEAFTNIGEVYRAAAEVSQKRFQQMSSSFQGYSQALNQLTSSYSDASVSNETILKLQKKMADAMMKMSDEQKAKLMVAGTPKAKQAVMTEMQEDEDRKNEGKKLTATLATSVDEDRRSFSRRYAKTNFLGYQNETRKLQSKEDIRSDSESMLSLMSVEQRKNASIALSDTNNKKNPIKVLKAMTQSGAISEDMAQALSAPSNSDNLNDLIEAMRKLDKQAKADAVAIIALKGAREANAKAERAAQDKLNGVRAALEDVARSKTAVMSRRVAQANFREDLGNRRSADIRGGTIDAASMAAKRQARFFGTEEQQAQVENVTAQAQIASETRLRQQGAMTSGRTDVTNAMLGQLERNANQKDDQGNPIVDKDKDAGKKILTDIMTQERQKAADNNLSPEQMVKNIKDRVDALQQNGPDAAANAAARNMHGNINVQADVQGAIEKTNQELANIGTDQLKQMEQTQRQHVENLAAIKTERSIKSFGGIQGFMQGPQYEREQRKNFGKGLSLMGSKDVEKKGRGAAMVGTQLQDLFGGGGLSSGLTDELRSMVTTGRKQNIESQLEKMAKQADRRGQPKIAAELRAKKKDAGQIAKDQAENAIKRDQMPDNIAKQVKILEDIRAALQARMNEGGVEKGPRGAIVAAGVNPVTGLPMPPMPPMPRQGGRHDADHGFPMPPMPGQGAGRRDLRDPWDNPHGFFMPPMPGQGAGGFPLGTLPVRNAATPAQAGVVPSGQTGAAAGGEPSVVIPTDAAEKPSSSDASPSRWPVLRKLTAWFDAFYRNFEADEERPRMPRTSSEIMNNLRPLPPAIDPNTGLPIPVASSQEGAPNYGPPPTINQETGLPRPNSPGEPSAQLFEDLSNTIKNFSTLLANINSSLTQVPPSQNDQSQAKISNELAATVKELVKVLNLAAKREEERATKTDEEAGKKGESRSNLDGSVAITGEIIVNALNTSDALKQAIMNEVLGRASEIVSKVALQTERGEKVTEAAQGRSTE